MVRRLRQLCSTQINETVLYKDNFATGNGELSKVIADIAQHSVMELCFSCFMNTKYKYLRCELPICNKCSVFESSLSIFLN